MQTVTPTEESSQTAKQIQRPSLDLFFETIHAFHQTAALRAAIELDLFTGVGEGDDTAETLAQRCGTSDRGMRILCNYLVVIGFLTRNGIHYELTADSKTFLDHRSAMYVGGAVEYLLSSPQVEPFRDLAAVVRKGGTTTSEGGVVAPNHPVWVKFAQAMVPVMVFPADALAKVVEADSGRKWKILDIGAGHGLYGISIAKRNPNAEIVAVDWENVLAVAKENARSQGVADRFRIIPGDALEVEYGGGYDIALMANILHHFDPTGVEKLLSKVYAALKPSGRCVILEFIPNEDRVSPPIAVEFALMMLATTLVGDAYTFSDYDQILRRVGFTKNDLHEIPPTYFRAVIAHK